jgi:hypothetical protein
MAIDRTRPTHAGIYTRQDILVGHKRRTARPLRRSEKHSPGPPEKSNYLKIGPGRGLACLLLQPFFGLFYLINSRR